MQSGQSFTAKDTKDAKESFTTKNPKTQRVAFRKVLFVSFESFVVMLYSAFLRVLRVLGGKALPQTGWARGWGARESASGAS
jgi:hypothetical protein